ncbi:hypothetical protein JCM11641_004650 [Rhodosporidiobolus odoratus]
MSPPPPDPVPATPSVPVKPVLTDLFAPTSLPDPTFFEPLSAVFLALPPTLSLSYAAFVPLFTLFYRSATTLPITLWQRRRTKRFAEVVMPLVRRKQAEIALQTRDECRRAGKTYEEYQKVFKKKAKEAAYALARKHSCSPRLTLILPPLFHIPIFITATLVLRDACARATSLLSVTTESLPSLLTASPSSQLTTTALSHLQDLAATSFLWCPSLALPDPTMFLPLFVGLASLLNVEVTARTRRATTSAAQALDRPAAPEQLASSQQQGGGVISAAEKRRFLARRAREGAPVNVRGLATSANPTGAGSGSVTADVGAGIKDDRQQRRVTNMLRGAAVAFIPLAGMAPSESAAAKANGAYSGRKGGQEMIHQLGVQRRLHRHAHDHKTIMDDTFNLTGLLAPLPNPSRGTPDQNQLATSSSTRHQSQAMEDTPTGTELAHHLSELAKARLPSPLKGLYKYFNRPGMLMFAGGLPPPEYFPFETISATSLVRNSYRTTDMGVGAWLMSWFSGGKKTDAWTINKFEEDKAKVQLSVALQYGTAAGLPALAQFIHEFTAKVYRPAYSDFATVINAGSTDAWSKIITTLANPGDGVLAEEWTYPSALATAWPNGIRPVPLPMDGVGMTPDGMDALLGGWKEEEHGGMKRPRVLYTIPVCQNPTGATMTLERKKAIYTLAVKYDVLIVEDDPYYFLQTGPYEPNTALRAQQSPKSKETDDEFLKSLVPSYLALDTEGRVIRIDTFSKTICPGSRLGWTTCNPVFAERLERANESSTQSASGMSQALVGKLLAEEWGFEGYLRWLKGIKAQYRTRRDALVDQLLTTGGASLETRQSSSTAWDSTPRYEMWTGAAGRDEKGFMGEVSEKSQQPRKLLSFVAPEGGMFVWLRVHFSEHKDYGRTKTSDLLQQLWEALAESTLLTAPGLMFSSSTFGPKLEQGQAEGQEVLAVTEEGDGFFRIAFSTATEAQMEEAAKILKKVVKEFFAQ